MKLQQAYISEAVAFGTWKIIGYKGPGDNTNGTNGGSKSTTTNFDYADATSGFTNESASLATARNIVGLTVSNKAKLNDCSPAANWKVTLTNNAGDTDGTFDATTDCAELTPSFNTIGK